MSTAITEYVDVRARVSALGLGVPTELAILPRGFETANSPVRLVHESDASTLVKLFRQAGIEARQLEPPEAHLSSIVQKSADWIAPTVFIGSMLLTQNPHAIQVALGVLQSYIGDFLKARLPSRKVTLSFVIETSKLRSYKKLTYEGPTSGIADLAEVVRKIQNE